MKDVERMISIFQTRKEFSSFLFGTLVVFAVFIAIPVFFIPGNSVSYYFSIEPWWGFILLGILSAEISFILTKRVFMILRKNVASKGIFKDSLVVVGSLLPSILACPILAVTALSFILPMTTIWTLVGLKWYFVGGLAVIMGFVVTYRIRRLKQGVT